MKDDSCNKRERRRNRCHSSSQGSLFERRDLAQDLLEFMGESLLIILDDNQLNILNQVFRPIFCGNVVEVTNEYVVLENVNIKMSNAPEFIFPTPLIIPLINIVWFTPFDPSIRFSLY